MNIAFQGLLVGYITAFTGMIMGCGIAFGTRKYGRRFQGSLMGFTGGLLISFVCFELLPNAFEGDTFYPVIVGMLVGVLLTAYLEGKSAKLYSKIKNGTRSREIKTGLLLALGILIHNFPEGIGIGSLYSITQFGAIRLCLIIALHCIPEGLAVALAFKESGWGFLKTIFIIGLLGIPMGMGSYLGVLLSSISQIFVSISFAFAGGVMLYITCGEIIPDSKEIWSGRMTTVGALTGFILGVMVIAGL